MADIRRTYSEYTVDIWRIYGVYTANGRLTYGEHTAKIRRTYGKHTTNIRRTYVKNCRGNTANIRQYHMSVSHQTYGGHTADIRRICANVMLVSHQTYGGHTTEIRRTYANMICQFPIKIQQIYGWLVLSEDAGRQQHVSGWRAICIGLSEIPGCIARGQQQRWLSLNRAILTCGVVRSTFFKWIWIVEMNMVDPGYYSLLSQQLQTDELSAACKKELLGGPSHQAALHKRMDRQVLPLQWIINRPKIRRTYGKHTSKTAAEIRRIYANIICQFLTKHTADIRRTYGEYAPMLC